jgi:hypothetical protein
VPESLSRNALLVKFFAQAYRGVPRTNLVKYIYEADLLAREYLGRPVSTFEYKRDKFGPYDDAIDEAVAELVAAGHVREEREGWFGNLKAGVRRQGAYLRVFDEHRPVSFDFDLGESAALDYVVTNYVPMPWKEFLYDVVYESAPMKAGTQMGKPLPMNAVNNAGTRRIGFRLEEVLRAEEAGRRGDFVTLTAFVDELRAQAPA